MTAQAAERSSSVDASPQTPLGESRWPPAVALVCFTVLTVVVRLWLPGDSPVRLPWLIPCIEVVLLLVLVGGDPRHLESRRRWVRPVAVALVIVLVLAALLATAFLVYDLVRGRGVTNSATE